MGREKEVERGIDKNTSSISKTHEKSGKKNSGKKKKGTFKLTLEFTEEYPNRPPLVKFVSKMYHPNIYADGGICLDILQKAWSPIYDVAAVLTSIQSLLSDPNPDSPANAEAARLYGENRREYNRRVKEVTERSWIEGDGGEGGGEGGEEEEEENGGGGGGGSDGAEATSTAAAAAAAAAAAGGGRGGGGGKEGEGADAAADAKATTAVDDSPRGDRPAGSAGAVPAFKEEEEKEEVKVERTSGERAGDDDNAAAATIAAAASPPAPAPSPVSS